MMQAPETGMSAAHAPAKPDTDPIAAEITAAVSALRGGDRSGGRRALEAIWSRIADDPQPLHECVLSHHLADAQDDAANELAWDLRALEAALRCADAEAWGQQQNLSMTLFMPSLHVNLAEDYFKLGDIARSQDHLASARSCVSHLPNDAYGQLIHRGIERLARQLAVRDLADAAQRKEGL